MLETGEDLRRLVGKDAYHEAFKDDTVAHLYTLREGGDAPIAECEALAEALGVTVDLRTSETRAAEALRLHHAYGIKSTQFIVEKLRRWADGNGHKLMVLLSYDLPSCIRYIEKGERFDEMFVEYLAANDIPHVDFLPKMAQEFRAYDLPMESFLERFYIERAGAQVFGHYRPYGNFWFAFGLLESLVEWLDPKPPSYR